MGGRAEERAGKEKQVGREKGRKGRREVVERI
jgi:hypothetical protein